MDGDGGGADAQWPMTVDQFLRGGYLQRSDVVLCRGKRSLFSRMIRWATKSSFSHTALVFLIPHAQLGFRNTFLLEAVPSGVEVTDLRHYLIDAASHYDVAIRRLERDWFDTDLQSLVRGRMLDFIKADYDFGTILAIAQSIARRMLFGIEAGLGSFERAIRSRHDRGELVPAQFICSGFVQYGYFSALASMVREGRIPPEAHDEVLFNPRLTRESDWSSLLSTTPQEVANSDRLSWKYAISKGMVYQVSSLAEVMHVFDAEPRR